MRFMKFLISKSKKYPEKLASESQDLNKVAILMKEYLEDTSNLIYYDKKAMD